MISLIGLLVSIILIVVTYILTRKCIHRNRKKKLPKSTFEDLKPNDNYVLLDSQEKYDKIKTFPELLRFRAEVNPDRVVYLWVNEDVEEEGRLTCSELLSVIRGLAASKEFSKLKKGDEVFLMFPPGLEYNITFLTCLYVGVVPLPLYPPSKYKRDIKNLVYAAKRSTTRHILTSISIHYKFLFLSLLVEDFRPTRFSWIYVPSFAKLKKKFCNMKKLNTKIEEISRSIKEDDIAYIQFSSGATQATQKGIYVKHKQFMRSLFLVHENVCPPSPDVNYWTMCTFAPPYGDVGLFLGIGSSIYLGCTTILFSPMDFLKNPTMWLEVINRYKCNYSLTVGEFLDYMIKTVPKKDREKFPLPKDCYIVIGAQKVHARTIRRFKNTFKYNSFICAYGLTEFTLGASISKERKAKIVKFDKRSFYKGTIKPILDENAQEEVYIESVALGEIVKEAEYAIVNPSTLKELEPLRIGELLLADDCVCEKYLDEEEFTKQTFNIQYEKIDGEMSEKKFLRTNDFCFIYNNELFFVDRINDMINYKGKSIYPFLIETIVDDSHEFIKVSKVVMFKKYKELEEDQLVIVVEIFEKHSKKYLEPVFESIIIDLGKEFGIVPSYIMIVKENSLPTTGSGKYSRFALRQQILQKKLRALEVKDNSSIKDQEDLKYFEKRWENEDGNSMMMTDNQNEKGITNYLFSKIERLRDLDKKHTFIMQFIKERVSKVIDVENIDVTQPLASYGLSSLMAVQLANELSKSVGKKVSATLLFNYPTVEKLSFFLETSIFKIREKTEFIIKGILGIDERREDIAVVGVGCKYSGGANNVNKYWQLLKEGKSGICFVPSDRWNIDDYYDPDPEAPGKMYTKKGGFIENMECFDPTFFNMSPREAESMDPQQKLLLQVSWNAFENAGMIPKDLFESKTGVFVASCAYDYCGLLSQIKTKNPEIAKKFDYRYVATGTTGSVLAGRLSYFYGFQGPAITIDTACSSSLVSTHLACQSLQNGECDLALSGGVNLTLDPEYYVTFTKTRMLSPDGQCKTFDDSANGYVRGEGCGMLLLKRYKDAVKDGDRILGVIKGSAYNQDGKSAGITAPNSLSQEIVIKTALFNADVHPNEIDYIEAHGTGTSLGDPIEIQSLMSVFGGKERDNPLTIGSVKTNIGHTEGAAGAAGLLKVILSMRNDYIPKHLNLSTLNTKIPLLQFQMIPMYIPYVEGMEWERSDRRRIAGVSSFGFSGTNCHVIVGEGPEEIDENEPKELEKDGMFEDVFCISAKSEYSLNELIKGYDGFLKENFEDISFHGLCYTQNTSRTHFDQYRIALKTDTLTKLTNKINYFAKDEKEKAGIGVFRANKNKGGRIGSNPKVVFLFTGQGSQYVNMGKELFEKQEIFKHWMLKCDEILKPLLDGVSIIDIIYSEKEEENSKLQTAKYVQPCLFAIEYSATKMWMSWGIFPDIVMGHSLGEIVAACVSDIISLEDGLKLISLRGKYMSEAEKGGMAAVFTSEENVLDLIKKSKTHVSIASINGPTNVVVSGAIEDIEKFLEYLEKQKIKNVKLNVEKAFHSEMMDSILEDFERSIRRIKYDLPVVSIVSNLYGELVDDDSLKFKLDSKYWKRHIRNPVLFMKGVEALLQKNPNENLLFLEVGPQNHLISMIRRIIPETEDKRIMYVGTLNQKKNILLNSICEVYTTGLDFNWKKYYEGEIMKHKKFLRKKITKLDLPVYPFQNRRFEVYSYRGFSINKEVGYSDKGSYSHPLVGNRFLLKNKIVFQKELNEDIYEDHKIFGHLVFPATGYLELLHETGKSFNENKIVVINDLKLDEPLRTSESIIIQTHCTKKNNGNSIQTEVLSIKDESEWKLHSTSITTFEEGESIYSKETFDELSENYNRINADFYDLISRFGYTYGKTFSSLKDIYSGENVSLGKIDIHKDIHQVGVYNIHPSVLDSCFHSIVPLVMNRPEDLGCYLPFSVKKTKFYPLGEKKQVTSVWVKSTLIKQLKNALVADLEVYSSEDNMLLVKMEGFELRKVNRTMFEKLLGVERKIFYKTEWVKDEKFEKSGVEERTKNLLRELKNKENQKLLIFNDKKVLGKEIISILNNNGINNEHILVDVGEKFEKKSKTLFEINPGNEKDYLELFSDSDVRKCSMIIHLWSLLLPEFEEIAKDKETFKKGLTVNCISNLYLIKGLVLKSLKVKLMCVTRNVHGEKEINHNQSTLWGMARTIALEHSELGLVMLDLNKSDVQNDGLVIVEQLFSKNRIENGLYNNELSWKNGNIYKSLLKETNIENQEKVNYEGKVFVISGGLGGLGKAVGEKLISLNAERVVLLTRRKVTEKMIKELNNDKLVIEQADVLDINSLRRVFETHKPNGIIHCAGVWKDNLIMNMSKEDFETVALPKVLGGYNLHVVSLEHKIEDFIMFSSSAATLGSPGQVNYTAGNYYLDSLVRYRWSKNLPGLSLMWGSWSEIGLAAKTSSDKFVEKFGMKNFTAKEGIDIFTELLNMKQFSVSPVIVDWKRFFNVRMEPLPFFYSHLIKSNRWKRKKNKGGSGMKTMKKRVWALRKDPRKQKSYVIGEIQRKVSGVLQTDPEEVDVSRPLMELGMDSLSAIELRNVVNESTGLNLPATLLFDYPNIEKLSEYLTQELSTEEEEDLSESLIIKEEEKEDNSTKIDKISSFSFSSEDDNEGIAIIGYSCRLPTGTLNCKDNDPESFWKMIIGSQGCSEEIPPNRFDYEDYFDENGGNKKIYVKWGTFVNKPFHFDPQFFGISNEEAKTMDPQQRLLLEVTWEALEKSGLIPKDLVGTPTGVFIGNMFLDYKELVNYYEIVNYAGTGNHLSVLAGRVSYIFGFQGPVITMDTACSSSLVSTHLACESLKNGECNLAVAGGVNLLISPSNYISECSMRMLSPEGLCKTFDDGADGYLRGEGCGIVILKRLKDAKRDGDNILAVIRGSAVNHDGRSAGLTAPNVKSQEKVIKKALSTAGLKPNDIGMIEAHGTGTSLGDPIEIRALERVFGKNREYPLYLSSVKTNIGHTEGCAGIAGILKLILCLQNEVIPRHLNFKKLNKILPNLDDLKMVIPTEKPLEWKRSEERKRIAAVSSFGFSGTNAHMIVEEGIKVDEATLIENSQKEETKNLKFLFLSAKNLKSLKNLSFNTLEFIRKTVGKYSLEDICYTINLKKSVFNCRVAICGKNRKEIIQNLNKFVCDDEVGEKVQKNEIFNYSYNDVGMANPKIVFCFTGQGAQYLGMGKEFYDGNKYFKSLMDKCDDILKNLLNGESILDIIFNNEEKLLNTKYMQPALFCLEYSMSKYLENTIGTTADYLIGHSLGEVVAACVSGVMSLEDSLKLIVLRGKCMQESKEGSMAAIFTSEENVQKEIESSGLKVSIASVNGQTNTVITGTNENISAILEIFKNKKYKFKKLNVKNAFHSELMDPVLDEFYNGIENFRYNEPSIPIVSNLYGKIIEDFSENTINGTYWKNHIRSKVDFLKGVEELTKKEKNIVFVEVGPQPHLINMIKRILADSNGMLYIQTFREKTNTEGENICKLFTNNVGFEAKRLYEIQKDENNWKYDFIPYSNLPVYPFDEREYNCVPEGDKIVREMVYDIEWEKCELDEKKNTKIEGTVLCFSDLADEFGRKLGEFFQKKNVDIVGVVSGEGDEVSMMNEEPPIFSIDVNNPDHFKQVFDDEVWKRKKPLTHIIHCMSLDIEDEEEPEDESIENSVRLNCGTMITIIKELRNRSLSPKFLYLTRNVYNDYTMFDKMGSGESEDDGDDSDEDSDENEEEAPSILQSYIWGVGKALRLEHPELDFKMIDVEESTKPKTVYFELNNKNNENEIAYLNEERYVPRIRKIGKNRKTKPFIIKDSDCFIVSGGTSGLGFAFTKFLIERKGLKKAVLLSRSGVRNEKTKQEIEDLRETYEGLEIIIEKVDISKAEDMSECINRIVNEKNLQITGVLNCAGIFDNCIFADQDFDRFHKLFLPKVYGTLNIHNALKEHEQEVKYFIMFSSDVSTFGDAGQSSYCGVNAFLDVFSGFRRYQGLNSISINWGLFGDIGSVSETTHDEKSVKILKFSGQCLIDSKTSFEMFEKIMSTKDKCRMGGVRLHINNLIKYKFNHIAPPLIKNLKLKSKREKGRGTFGSEGEEEEEEIAQMILTLQESEKNRKKYSSEELFAEYQKKLIRKDIMEMVEEMLGKSGIDGSVDLQEIGVDSITALSIRNNLSKYTGISLPVNMAFTNPNLDSIAVFIYEQKEKVLSSFNDKKKEQKNLQILSKDETEEESSISFFEGVKILVKNFVTALLKKVLKDNTITDNEHLHELEANVEITNEVRDTIKKEFSVVIEVEEFFKRPTILRYSNLILKNLFKNMTGKFELFEEMEIDTKLPASLGYIYNSNFVQVAKERKEKKLRLFMTPPAGMNPSFYRKMINYFPEEIELCFIHLPGRTSRLNENLELNMMKLANQIVDALEYILKLDNIPYALYGHCMGTQINYEVFSEIRRRNLKLPIHFFVFSGHAPHITNGLFPNYNLNDDGILEFIKQTNGGVLPKPLKNKEMNKLVFSIMRADLQKVSSQDIVQKEDENGNLIYYHNYYKEMLKKMDTNITSWGGAKDQFVPEKYIKQWRDLTTGEFTFEIFPESDHYAYVDVMGEIKDEQIIKKIVKEVEKLI